MKVYNDKEIDGSKRWKKRGLRSSLEVKLGIELGIELKQLDGYLRGKNKFLLIHASNPDRNRSFRVV